MAGFSSKKKVLSPGPIVLVVHCVDTEGPIGGDVRRHPDGSKEFMGNWDDIKTTLNDITVDEFRQQNSDSFENPFMLNWFIMDFTGFKTNPKERIQAYNDTYDNIKSLNTSLDSFHWHYHQPPKTGVGDQWSDDWNSSNEHYNILGHRLLDRQDFPEVFRAGGAIEDNKCSLWLEDNLMIDYSNRVSYRSCPTDNIFDFSWYNSPSHWGYYHPSKDDLICPGQMKRHVVRCVDLRSRLHELQSWEVNEAFGYALMFSKPIILSYFSHDHRDMRAETYHVIKLVQEASRNYGVPFEWCDAKEALQKSAGLIPKNVKIGFERQNDLRLMIHFGESIYQKHPFVFTRMSDGDIQYHKLDLEYVPNCPYYLCRTFLETTPDMKQVGVACTSTSGDKSIKVLDLGRVIT